jgi:hypothetical protein
MTSTMVVCPACGADNLGTRFCESCGTPAPAPAQPATSEVAELADPPAAPVQPGLLNGVALRTLAVGPVAIILFPAIAGSILVLLGGLGEGAYYEGFAARGSSTYLRAVDLAWPLTLALALITALAGVVAAVTSGKTVPIKVGAIALVVIGCALLALEDWGWVLGGAALASAWIVLAGLRGWSFYTLFIPLVSGFIATFALVSAEIHIIVGAVVMGLLAAVTVAGIVLLGWSLSAAHARQPPRPPPAPRPVAPPPPAYATGQLVQVQLADGQIVPVATGVVAGYPPGYAAGYGMQQRTNGFAIAALVLGLLSGTILPIIFGHVALSQIRRTGERGAGMATVGLVFGYLWTAVVVIYLIWVASNVARIF